MPISELPAFEPIPDPPEGWRFVAKGEAFDPRAKFWSKTSGSWLLTGQLGAYSKVHTYIVPIDPPAPTYRPFKDAAEFDPFALRPWRYKSDDESVRRPSAIYSDEYHNDDRLRDSLDEKVFTDGTPFGVKVEQ
jgi:hypothetical protein